MQERPSVLVGDFVGSDLTESVRRAPPKLLLLVAPAGFGKSAMASAFARETPSVVVDDAERLPDLDNALRQVALDRPGALTIVASRRPLVIPFSIALPSETRVLRAGDLRFTSARIADFMAAIEPTDAQIDGLHAVTLGWPAALALARRRAHESDLARALDDLDALADVAFARYVTDEAIASLSDAARSLVLLTSFAPIALADVEVLLAARTESALEEIEDGFLTRDPATGTYRLHPLLKRAIHRRLAPDARAAAAALAQAFEGAGLPLRAASWHLRAGDDRAANAAYGRQTFASMTAISSDDALVAAKLDTAALVDNLAIFNVAAIEQLYTRDYNHWFTLAERALMRAPVSAPADVRALAIIAIVSRYAYFGRFDDARRVLAAQTALLEGRPEYRFTLDYCDAFIRASHDEAVDLDDLRLRLGAFILDPYGRVGFAALAAYVYGVQGNWPAQRDELLVAIETLTGAQQHMHLAETLMMASFFAWFYGDDVSLRDALDRLERTPADVGSDFFLRAVRDADPPNVEGYETAQVRVYAYLIAASTARDGGRARWYARRALVEAERTARRFFSVLAHLALALLNAPEAAEHLASAAALADAVASPALQRAVAELARGGEDSGMLHAFRRRYAAAPRDAGLLTVNVLDATIAWEGEPLALKDRPRQVVLALALAGAPLRGEELAARVWPDRDPQGMQNALRVHIAAIRKAAHPSAIVYDGGRYRIAAAHAIDLDAAEMLVRQTARSKPLGPPMRQSLDALVAGIERRAHAWDDLDWFEAIARRIDALRGSALVTLGEDALDRGDVAAALRYAGLQIARDACDERAYAISMRAHIQVGEDAEARREYRAYRRALRDELGIELTPDLEDDEALRSLIRDSAARG